MKLYTAYDSKVKAFLRPFWQRNTGEAMRTWESMCNDETQMPCRHPEDFTLFELASFDELTGKISALETPHSIATALSVRKKTDYTSNKSLALADAEAQ